MRGVVEEPEPDTGLKGDEGAEIPAAPWLQHGGNFMTFMRKLYDFFPVGESRLLW